MKRLLFILGIMMLMITSIVNVSAVEGLDMSTIEVEFDGKELVAGNSTNLFSIKKGEELPIKICLIPEEDVHVSFEVAMIGGDYTQLDARADTGKKVTFYKGIYDCATTELKIHDRVEIGEYTLRVFAFDRFSSSASSFKDYKFFVNGEQDEIEFSKVDLPNTVMAGRELNPKVFIRNNGRNNETRVDIQAFLAFQDGTEIEKSNIVSIEELAVNGNSQPSEEMLIEVPANLPEGTYKVKFVASYDMDFSQDEFVTTIKVTGCLGQCDGKVIANDDTAIKVSTTSKEVFAGESVIYPISVANEGSRSVAYRVDVKDANFAVAQVTPLNFFNLEAGKSTVIYVELTPKPGVRAQDYTFGVDIYADDELVSSESMLTSVIGEAKSGLEFETKSLLQISLVVVVFVLIILALIVTFKKMRDNDDEDEDFLKGDTYY